jgi:hypothetical protein
MRPTSQEVSKLEQPNNLIELCQAIYEHGQEHGFTKTRDTQFELGNTLLLSSPICSFTELSLSPLFRRKWSSAYAAIEDGRRDREWLERLFVGRIPLKGNQVFSLDDTTWLYPEARTLADRQHIYSGGRIVVGHPNPY